MAGYYDFTNPGRQFMPSAQGAPVNLMSGAGNAPSGQQQPMGAGQQQPMGAGPALSPKQMYQPGLANSQQFNPTAPGTSTYGQFQNSPQWLQDYIGKRVKNEGQAGFYDPTLQMRDIYQGLAPDIQRLTQQYGNKAFQNPYFARSSDPFRYGQQNGSGKFDPFTYDQELAGGAQYERNNAFSGADLGYGRSWAGYASAPSVGQPGYNWMDHLMGSINSRNPEYGR